MSISIMIVVMMMIIVIIIMIMITIVNRMQQKAPIFASVAISATRDDYQSRGQKDGPAGCAYPLR